MDMVSEIETVYQKNELIFIYRLIESKFWVSIDGDTDQRSTLNSKLDLKDFYRIFSRGQTVKITLEYLFNDLWLIV